MSCTQGTSRSNTQSFAKYLSISSDRTSPLAIGALGGLQAVKKQPGACCICALAAFNRPWPLDSLQLLAQKNDLGMVDMSIGID